MGAYVSHKSFDCFPNDPVPVIASFDALGNMKPIYVRIDGESFKVLASWEKSRFNNVLDFMCHIQVHNQIKNLSLQYFKAEQMWIIPDYKT